MYTYMYLIAACIRVTRGAVTYRVRHGCLWDENRAHRLPVFSTLPAELCLG